MKNIERLYKLFKTKTKEEASYKVYAQATYYPHFVQIYIPNKPIEKLLTGMESTTTSITKTKRYSTKEEDDIERSLRRTKKTIRQYALCNQFDLFTTFTFKEDRQDITKCKSKMSNWIKNQQKRTGKFAYLIVPEFHKDQQSLHFHALMKNYAGKIIEAIDPNTGKVLRQNGRIVYELPAYRLGFSNVKRIEDTPESHARVGSYVSKYITKDMPLLFGKNRYWVSSSLNLPLVEDNPEEWYLEKRPSWSAQTERGTTLVFPLTGLNTMVGAATE